MKPFEFDNNFFLSHHCPPIKMTDRELNRLREAVNWQIDKWIKELKLAETIEAAMTIEALPNNRVNFTGGSSASR